MHPLCTCQNRSDWRFRYRFLATAEGGLILLEFTEFAGDFTMLIK